MAYWLTLSFLLAKREITAEFSDQTTDVIAMVLEASDYDAEMARQMLIEMHRCVCYARQLRCFCTPFGRLVHLRPDARDERKWSEEASSGPPRMSDRLSPRDKMNTTSDSSTNQMFFHGVPSNVHSFLVSY